MNKLKKVLFFASVLLIGVCIYVCNIEYTHEVYEIKISEVLISNNSVGNEWTKHHSINGTSITGKEQWSVPIGIEKMLKINSTIIERDSWDDVGRGTLTVTLKKDFETSNIITVRENKGRYKGNSAQWKITCKVKLVKRIRQK